MDNSRWYQTDLRRNLTRPLVLAIEVLSPASRRKDAVLKRSKYQDSGSSHYWIIDPAEPSILALELVESTYRTVGEAAGDTPLILDRPFPVTVAPGGSDPLSEHRTDQRIVDNSWGEPRNLTSFGM